MAPAGACVQASDGRPEKSKTCKLAVVLFSPSSSSFIHIHLSLSIYIYIYIYTYICVYVYIYIYIYIYVTDIHISALLSSPHRRVELIRRTSAQAMFAPSLGFRV